MHSSFPLSRKLLALAALAATALMASANDSLATSQHDHQVMERQFETMTIQMQTFRWEVDAAVRALPPGDERYAPAYALIKKGEELILRMRSAHPMEVNVLRGEFEKVRGDLDRLFGRGDA